MRIVLATDNGEVLEEHPGDVTLPTELFEAFDIAAWEILFTIEALLFMVRFSNVRFEWHGAMDAFTVAPNACMIKLS